MRASRGSVIVLFSDLIDLHDDALRAVAALGGGPRALVLVQVLDPRERDLSFAGKVRLRAIEGDTIVVTDADAVRDRYRAELAAHTAACRVAVEAQGGRAWTESTPGAGATFRFLWPKRPPAQRTPSAQRCRRWGARLRRAWASACLARPSARRGRALCLLRGRADTVILPHPPRRRCVPGPPRLLGLPAHFGTAVRPGQACEEHLVRVAELADALA